MGGKFLYPSRVKYVMTDHYPIAYEMDDATFYFEIETHDYATAKKFYVDVLGFKVCLDIMEEFGWAELELPVKGTKIGLNLKSEGIITQGSIVLCIGVKNLNETRAYLAGHHVKMGEIRDVPGMVSLMDAWDFEGNKLTIIGPPRMKSNA